MFSQFTQLKSLDLQQNDISMVEDGAFAGLTQLTTLLLQHNGLRTVSEEILLLPMARLTYLRIYDNPWNCDCSLETLVRTMQLPSNRNLGNYAKCAGPLSMRGHKLKKLNAELLCAADRDREVPSRPQIKVKPEVTSICRTYLFPKPLLDCSSKGEIRFCNSLHVSSCTFSWIHLWRQWKIVWLLSTSNFSLFWRVDLECLHIA